MNPISKPIVRASLRVLLAVAAIAGAGCSGQSLVLKPEAEVPAPLASRLPLHVAVHYPDEFRGYVYQENSDDRQNWSIDCGPAQVVLFNQVLPSLFAEVSQADGVPWTGPSGLDAILVPKVEEMQFALPHETRTDMYEAWIRYSVTLYQPDGTQIAEFPLTGYGKSTTSLFEGREEGLNSAINAAFRDVGARLTLGFRNNQAVKPWLAAKQAETGPGTRPGPETGPSTRPGPETGPDNDPETEPETHPMTGPASDDETNPETNPETELETNTETGP